MADASDAGNGNDGGIERRKLLSRATLVAAAAAAAKILTDTKTARAADGEPLILGMPNNVANRPTGLVMDTQGALGQFALMVQGNSDHAAAVWGQGFGASSVGVIGLDASSSLDPNEPITNAAGVYGLGGSGPGVIGRSTWGAAVVGLGSAAVIDPNDPMFRAPVGVVGVGEAAPGVLGRSALGPGLFGIVGDAAQSLDPNEPILPGPGVYGFGDAGPGVLGRSVSGPGLFGLAGGTQLSMDPLPAGGVVGVHGRLPDLDPNDPTPSAGVFGMSSQETGVSGWSTAGVGVRGIANLASMPGVLARNNAAGGVGLDVAGRAVFSSGGVWTIPKGAKEEFVPTTGVRQTSVVLVTFTTDIGARYVRWVEIRTDGFVVHLSGKASKSGAFNWLVLN